MEIGTGARYALQRSASLAPGFPWRGQMITISIYSGAPAGCMIAAAAMLAIPLGLWDLVDR